MGQSLSGKYANVAGVPSLIEWSATERLSAIQEARSNTAAGTFSRPGIYDTNGRWSASGGTPLVMPGEFFAFSGYTAPDNGVYNTPGNLYTLQNAMCTQVQIMWNWRTGEELRNTVQFAAGEPLRMQASSGAQVDESLFQPELVCGTKIEFGAIGQETEWKNLASATLTITNSAPTVVNSSTSCNTGRRQGIIDWNLRVVDEDTQRVLSVESDYRLKLYTTSILFWLLEVGQVTAMNDIRSRVAGGEIIGKNWEISMNAKDPDEASNGMIVRPGGDTGNPWWPDQYLAQNNVWSV